MLEQDYLMRIFLGFAEAIRQALEQHRTHEDAELSRAGLEEQIGMAADMDPDVLLALEPESCATILMLGTMDDSLAEYMVHALMLDVDFLDEDGFHETASLRRQQAEAIGEAFHTPYRRDRLDDLLNPLGAKDEKERIELEAQYGMGLDNGIKRS